MGRVLQACASARRIQMKTQTDYAPMNGLKQMPKGLREAYLEAAPHPENLQSFFDKCVERMQNFPDFPTEAIRGITAPALVIVGDADVMRPEHAVDLFPLLPYARLAVLPGTDHMALMTRSAWVAPMVGEFLDAAMPNNGR
jgi:pimeloyl-ACP methyl ester carboxylesterase